MWLHNIATPCRATPSYILVSGHPPHGKFESKFMRTINIITDP